MIHCTAGLQIGKEGDNKAYFRIDIIAKDDDSAWTKALNTYRKFGKFDELELNCLVLFNFRHIRYIK